jgi:thioredoxin 1
MAPNLRKVTTETRAPDEARSGGLLVACLCAEWCTACRAYRAVFGRVATEHPELRFLWVDVEDSAALVDQVDVENFPTILIGEGESPRFFGAITPQREVLIRLIAAHRHGGTIGEGNAADIRGLLSRLQSAAR